MTDMLMSSFLAPFALAGFAFAVRAQREVRALRAERDAMRDGTAAVERSFGLLAGEMQAIGLTLLGHAREGHDAPQAAASIADGAQRILSLSDQLTELLALRGGMRVVRAEPVHLMPVLEEAVAATATQLGPARRDWRLAPECASIALSADARALRGALEQVLARAARMTRDGDWIGVRPMVSEDSVAIVIEDEGAGLRAADAEPGAEAAPAMARTRGLGFGLSIARVLLEAHGGSLRVEALHGVGARTWLTLPRDRLLAC
jgi:signal transduction histidine kinase